LKLQYLSAKYKSKATKINTKEFLKKYMECFYSYHLNYYCEVRENLVLRVIKASFGKK